jgi:bifunctional DNA-binding transcriptional regulator/antitoxin component of YhaV-PrlF toxin-antitoxin module
MMTMQSMEYIAKVLPDGRLSLPEEVRKSLKLKTNSTVMVSISVKRRKNGKKNGKSKPPKKKHPLLALDDLAIDTGIPDFSEQHDHYIYGTSKR